MNIIFTRATELATSAIEEFRRDSQVNVLRAHAVRRFNTTMDDVKRMVLEAEEEEEEEDSSSSSSEEEASRKREFIESSSEEEESSSSAPESDAAYDRSVMKHLIPKNKTRRTNGKITRFEPGGPDDYIRVEDLMEEDDVPNEGNFAECQIFLTQLAEEGFAAASLNSAWYRRRYGNIIEGIRDNLGRQGGNKNALDIWDHIIADTHDCNFPFISYNVSNDNRLVTCALCDMKRRCVDVLTLGNKKRLPIGAKCRALAAALIIFHTTLRKCTSPKHAIPRLDRAMAKLQDAHANKKISL